MINDQVNLDLISKQDTYSVAISLLYSLKNNPKYSIVSELPYLVDYKDFINIIRYYGGTTIRIPTVEEISDTLKVLLLYQYKVVSQMKWNDALIKAGYSSEESLIAKNKLSELVKIFDNQNIGNRSYD